MLSRHSFKVERLRKIDLNRATSHRRQEALKHMLLAARLRNRYTGRYCVVGRVERLVRLVFDVLDAESFIFLSMPTIFFWLLPVALEHSMCRLSCLV